jgi:hypothetical protein
MDRFSSTTLAVIAMKSELLWIFERLAKSKRPEALKHPHPPLASTLIPSAHPCQANSCTCWSDSLAASQYCALEHWLDRLVHLTSYGRRDAPSDVPFGRAPCGQVAALSRCSAHQPLRLRQPTHI